MTQWTDVCPLYGKSWGQVPPGNCLVFFFFLTVSHLKEANYRTFSQHSGISPMILQCLLKIAPARKLKVRSMQSWSATWRQWASLTRWGEAKWSDCKTLNIVWVCKNAVLIPNFVSMSIPMKMRIQLSCCVAYKMVMVLNILSCIYYWS